MADWRQIRARIRRAKAGPDAATRLEQLYDKTRDGMVAFELAQLEELSGRIERATDWYKQAWQRFRRTEWKQKAEEALTRHGVPIPVATEEMPDHPQDSSSPAKPAGTESTAEATAEVTAAATAEVIAAAPPEPGPAEEQPQEEAQMPILQPEANGGIGAVSDEEPSPAPSTEAQAAPEAPSRPRRRRHRGGRGRGRGKRSAESAAKTKLPVEAEAPVETEAKPQAPAASPAPPRRSKEPARHAPAERRPARDRLPAVQIYRRGEPALASEIKTLEAKLRQLLAAQPHSIAELGDLPATPGVYLVSDLDLTTMYFLEACGNMRSAMDQLVSGRRSRQGSVRAQLAKYLGISDSQASRYLKQHCVARWIDLEESDSHALGHFARAVLRPELMEGSD